MQSKDSMKPNLTEDRLRLVRRLEELVELPWTPGSWSETLAINTQGTLVEEPLSRFYRAPPNGAQPLRPELRYLANAACELAARARMPAQLVDSERVRELEASMPSRAGD